MVKAECWSAGVSGLARPEFLVVWLFMLYVGVVVAGFPSTGCWRTLSVALFHVTTLYIPTKCQNFLRGVH
jgi:hypothetical protein